MPPTSTQAIRPLIATKFQIPPASASHIARPRLTIDPNSRLTVISGAAGYGKTTAAAAWAREGNMPVAWLTLADGDESRFWEYCLAALQSLLETNSLERGETIEDTLAAAINHFAILDNPCALVIDNYQFIQGAAIHRQVTFLVENLPAQLHLVLVSRGAPPLPLARLRGLGQLQEISEIDLRFTRDEIESLFRQFALDVSDTLLSQIENCTRGWATGLALAAHALAGPNASLDDARRYIADYFLEEVLNSQPAEIAAFLLKTSTLESLSADSCRAVTDEVDNQAVLESLHRQQLFIEQLDEGRRSYRYQPLFRAFLRTALAYRWPEQVTSLHRRAADWYAANHQLPEAVNHALAAHNYALAADYAQQAAENMWSGGQILTLKRWLDSLPAELVESNAWLLLFRAWSIFLCTQHLYAAENTLEAVQRLMSPDMTGIVETIAAAFATRRDDAEAVIQHTQTAFETLDSSNLRWRAVALLNLGIAHILKGESGNANTTLSESVAISRICDSRMTEVMATYNLGRIQWLQGNLQQAAAHYQSAIRLGSSLQLPLAAGAYIGLGIIQYEWDNGDTAEANLRHGLDLCLQIGNVEAPLIGHLCLARLYRSRGDLEGALGHVQAAERLAAESGQPRSAKRVAAFKALLWLAQGNLGAARHWAEHHYWVESPLDARHESEYLVLARLLLADGRLDEAFALFDSLLSAANQTGRLRSMIEILLLEAVAHELSAKRAHALDTLERALSLAEPGGFVRLFVDEGEPARLLLGALPASPYTERLLEAFAEGRHTPIRLTERLSGREMEVLGLLARGLSNDQIAAHLTVAPSTIKTHVKSIYRKLDVNSRFEAVERARTLTLIAS
jgi:LuxR family maltose regulon positive regulatory protein